MEKPNKEDDKYWLPMVIDKVKGTKEIPFYHLYYERDLERYIEYLESKVNNGVLDDVIVIHLKALTKKIEDSHSYGFDDVLQDYLDSL